MLLEPTLDKLTTLQLHGMVAALRQWQAQPPRELLAPLDLVGLLADAEWLTRENRKMTTRLKAAKLKLTACVEDLDSRHPRGLPKALVQDLSASRWVAAHQTVVITGPTGVGKSYIACALAHKACRDGFTVAYRRVSRLYDELAQARADGTYLTALDDFGLDPSARPTGRASSKSSRIATTSPPRSSPANSIRRTGTRSSATRPWRTRSATGSSTAPTGSRFTVSRCGSRRRP